MKICFAIFWACVSIFLSVSIGSAQSESPEPQSYYSGEESVNEFLLDGEILFEEEFNNNENNWPISDTSADRMIVREGYYEVFKESAYACPLIYSELFEEDDFVIESTMRQLSGSDYSSYGIVWGGANGSNYYLFSITNANLYNVRKMTNYDLHYFIEFTSTIHLNKGEENTLILEKTGNTIKFYVNGMYLNEMQSESFYGSKIGFYVGSGSEIQIDNLIVRSTSGLSTKYSYEYEEELEWGDTADGGDEYSWDEEESPESEEEYSWEYDEEEPAEDEGSYSEDYSAEEVPEETIEESYWEDYSTEEVPEENIREEYTPAKRNVQAFPPDLILENLRFTEPSGNRALDGNEVGQIEFDLMNRGRGMAFDMEIKVTPLTSGMNLSYQTTTYISELDKKSNRSISVPIEADFDVQSEERQFRIEVIEVNGFDVDPAVIAFETQAFAPPELRIEQIAIDDNEDAEGEGYSYGNGNSIIEPGESIEVSAYVQNFGEGGAENVVAEVIINTDDRNFSYPDAGKEIRLGDIGSGDYKKVDFYFYTSRRYDENNLPISIKLTEEKGKFGKTLDLGLKLGKRSRNVMEVQVARVETQKRNSGMREIEGVVRLADVDKDIPTTKMNGKDVLAVIIGIEDYKYAPNVDYAARDAQTFYQYAKSVFGIPERNIYFRVNDGATSGEFRKIFSDDGWITRRLRSEKTDVMIYYSGHGAPDIKSERGYLIPSDIDPNYANTGFSLDDMYSFLSKIKARSVSVFIDACFSGESRSKEMLIKGIRPLSIRIENPLLTNDNSIVMTASNGSQYSSAYPDKNHGLFTYFLLKGLKGEARGRDKKLTIDELYNYVHKNVSETAGYLDKEQTPGIIGKPSDRILVEF